MGQQEFDPKRRQVLKYCAWGIGILLATPPAVALLEACQGIYPDAPIREVKSREEIDRLIKQYKGREFQFAPAGKEGIIHPAVVGEIRSFDSQRQQLEVFLGGGAPAVFHENIGSAERLVYRGPGFFTLIISPNDANPQMRTFVTTVACERFRPYFDFTSGVVTVGGEECFWQDEGYEKIVTSFTHIKPLNLERDLSSQELEEILAPEKAVWAVSENNPQVEIVSKGRFKGEELSKVLVETVDRERSLRVVMRPNLLVVW